MDCPDSFGFGTQIRKSPYFEATVNWGAKAFSVYNHMYIPRDFGDPEHNFWNLVNDAILCDVVRGTGKVGVGLSDGIWAVWMEMAAQESAQTGQAVRLAVQ